jgi:hypothetical protein
MASAAFISEAREMRVRFSSREALEAGVDRAEREPWVARWRVDRFRRELVLELAGGFGVRPPLRVVPLASSSRPN